MGDEGVKQCKMKIEQGLYRYLFHFCFASEYTMKMKVLNQVFKWLPNTGGGEYKTSRLPSCKWQGTVNNESKCKYNLQVFQKSSPGPEPILVTNAQFNAWSRAKIILRQNQCHMLSLIQCSWHVRHFVVSGRQKTKLRHVAEITL